MIREAIDTSITAERLRPVLLRLARELRKETEALGVTGRQAALLWLVREHPGLTLGELAELERISAPSLSAHVDRLERAGLLARVRSSEDRRRVGLELTPAGSSLLRRVRRRRTTWLAQRLAALGDRDLEAIDRAIEPLATLLEGEGACHGRSRRSTAERSPASDATGTTASTSSGRSSRSPERGCRTSRLRGS